MECRTALFSSKFVSVVYSTSVLFSPDILECFGNFNLASLDGCRKFQLVVINISFDFSCNTNKELGKIVLVLCP